MSFGDGGGCGEGGALVLGWRFVGVIVRCVCDDCSIELEAWVSVIRLACDGICE